MKSTPKSKLFSHLLQCARTVSDTGVLAITNPDPRYDNSLYTHPPNKALKEALEHLSNKLNIDDDEDALSEVLVDLLLQQVDWILKMFDPSNSPCFVLSTTRGQRINCRSLREEFREFVSSAQ